MFDQLTNKLSTILQKLTDRGSLNEKDVDETLQQIRIALLEADVNFKVVKDFVGKVREKALEAVLMPSLTSSQQVIKIVHGELTATLTGQNHKLNPSSRNPTVIMMVGLQGSGKTTSIVKLASHLKKLGQESLLVAGDLKRPAAVQQLQILGDKAGIDVYCADHPTTLSDVTQLGIERAKQLGIHSVLIDTAGRLHIDEEMMEELKELTNSTGIDEILLVADAMTGQDAVTVAEEFYRIIPLTGLFLTKLDGDARGGAALSITAVTGVPIKFVGVGEKIDAIEPFYPDRLASRILGMGDVLTLIDKAKEVFDDKRSKELEKKMRKASFDLEDFLEQLQGIRRMGSLSQFVDMIPGFHQMSKKVPQDAFDDNNLNKIETIIHSMTLRERHNPEIINGSRRRRIASGSGTKPEEVNQLLNQFGRAQKMMRQMYKNRIPKGLPGFLK